MTLALGNHPIVDGWDADVIAEDHHMYMKCMMASYWEEIFSIKRIENVSKLQLKPIWLPVTSYLVEDPSGGYFASCYARFQQARRHSQGVAEFSYILLQWISVWYETHGQMPLRSHAQIFCLAYKYCTVHIWNTVTAMFYLLISFMSSLMFLQSLIDGSFVERAYSFYNFDAQEEDKEMVLYLLATIPLQVTAGICMISGCFLVFKDSLEGRYCPLHLMISADEKKSGKEVQYMTFWESCKLFVWIAAEMISLAAPGLVVFGCIPLILAAISLSTNGHKFEYIVAAKPEGANGSVAVHEKSVAVNTSQNNQKYVPVAREDEEMYLEGETAGMYSREVSKDALNVPVGLRQHQVPLPDISHKLPSMGEFKRGGHSTTASTSTASGKGQTNSTGLSSSGASGTFSGMTSGMTSGLTSGNISEREEV
jgi:hypothetical protein